MKIGLGFDCHPFDETDGRKLILVDETDGRKLILGGVIFEGETGLVGHSDGDVVAHACADSLLGASGLGDLGQHFPDDKKLESQDSIQMLKEVVRKVRRAGFLVENIDCVVVTDHPKISDKRDQMQKNLSACVRAPVSVGGKRTEGMNVGKEGITCFAVALLNETENKY